MKMEKLQHIITMDAMSVKVTNNKQNRKGIKMTIKEGVDKAVEPIIDKFDGSFFLKTRLTDYRDSGETRWVIHHCDCCGEPYFRRKYCWHRAKHKTCDKKCLTVLKKKEGRFSSPLNLRKSSGGHLYFKDKNYGRPHHVVWAHHWTIFQETGNWPKEAVHHIDINKENNEFSNLWECTNSMHMTAHTSLNALTADLFKMNIIKFNRKTGEYTLNKKKKGKQNETND